MTPAEALTKLLACVATEYASEPETKVVAQPGEQMTQDWCAGDCAMAFVRVATLGTSSTAFPEVDALPTGRTGPLMVRFEVGLARCVHGLDAQGNAPAAELQTADAFQLLTDATKLRHAVQCCLIDWPTPGRKSTHLGAWQPMGPFGNCAGGYWPLSVRTG